MIVLDEEDGSLTSYISAASAMDRIAMSLALHFYDFIERMEDSARSMYIQATGF